jgi:long-subunit acyl-CoA synthetase (AMP-forming)
VEALALWSVAQGRETPSSAAGLLEAAEHALAGGEASAETWGAWLDTTGRSAFLRSLPEVAPKAPLLTLSPPPAGGWPKAGKGAGADAPARERWAETAFRAIRLSAYSLRRMLADRAAEHPERILFEDSRELDAPRWTYSEVRRYARSIAGVFLDASPSPRVAILCDNNVDAAAADLAAEALIAELGHVRPTGLISVPVRWTQIRDQCLEALEGAPGADAEAEAFRAIVGERLRWGLSAAGWLDPQVFRFFQRHGVDLCSGFGMTEATGGITMTPPGAYRDGSVGIPLPGIRTRLGAEGELEISGVYVAAPLDADGAPGSLPRPDPDEERWLATGDLFRESADGDLEIVDRIKDIYKNSRGQTIAPQRVEQKFAGVPGFRRVFLAGDHRDHNG